MKTFRLTATEAPRPSLSASCRVLETAAIDDFVHSNAMALVFEYDSEEETYKRHQSIYSTVRRHHPDLDISISKDRIIIFKK